MSDSNPSPAAVTVHIEDVPVSSITDALIAIESYDQRMQGMPWYDETHAKLTALVVGLRAAQDQLSTRRIP